MSALAFAFVATGCPNNPGGDCEPACGEGFVCDGSTSQCVRPVLPEWEDDPPGRGARVEIAGGQAVTVSIDPATRQVVTGAGLRDAPFDFRILGTIGRTAPARVAIDASAGRVAVVWVAEGSRFGLAWRDSTGRHERWSTTTVVPDVDGYSATEDFDIGVDPDGGVRIVFRDGDRTLRVATHAADLGTDGWAFETIDDGETTAGASCSERESGARQGVGEDPDLVVREDGASVAYHDIDCGDLRWATLGASGWNVGTVDVGDPLPASTGGGTARVGRYPSVAYDATGRPHIAYQDESFGRLLLAVASSEGDWNVEVVDRGVTLDVGSRERKDVVGAFARLTFDDRGLPSITYFDATSTALRLASRGEGDDQWSRRILAAEGAVGFFADHDYDATVGRVAVAEKVERTSDGIVSRLRIVWEEGS